MIVILDLKKSHVQSWIHRIGAEKEKKTPNEDLKHLNEQGSRDIYQNLMGFDFNCCLINVTEGFFSFFSFFLLLTVQ